MKMMTIVERLSMKFLEFSLMDKKFSYLLSVFISMFSYSLPLPPDQVLDGQVDPSPLPCVGYDVPMDNVQDTRFQE